MFFSHMTNCQKAVRQCNCNASKAYSLVKEGEKWTADAIAITINCDPWIYFMTFNIFKSIFHCHNMWISMRVCVCCSGRVCVCVCIVKCSLNIDSSNSWGWLAPKNENFATKCGGKSTLLLLFEIPQSCFHITKSSCNFLNFILSS